MGIFRGSRLFPPGIGGGLFFFVVENVVAAVVVVINGSGVGILADGRERERERDKVGNNKMAAG